jgi:aspartyl-tRNA(Asn)/glutamyl-tRNA(Gln) amidotransferase subunit C
MSDYIDKETFDHLVTLAALELTNAEGEYLRKELNNQMRSVHELEAIPLDENITITSHGVPFTAENSLAPREDEWHPCENPAEILEQTPKIEDGYIVVPDIPHTTLE